jgi:hypothetical protein
MSHVNAKLNITPKVSDPTTSTFFTEGSFENFRIVEDDVDIAEEVVFFAEFNISEEVKAAQTAKAIAFEG